MTETELDLARRLAAHPKWHDALKRHGFAMVVSHKHHERPMVVVRAWDEGGVKIVGDGAFNAGADSATCVPELDRPPTQGCLWAMLREVGGTVTVHSDVRNLDSYGDLPFIAQFDVASGEEQGTTLGEALARALLTAWGEP